MKIYSSITVIFLLAFSIGCSGLSFGRIGSVDNSYRLKGEIIEIETYKDTADPESIGDFGIGEVVGVAIDLIEGQLRKEAARYTQDYSGTTFGSDQVRKIVITRYVDIEQQDKKQVASRFVFELEQVDSTQVFEIKLNSYVINYAKAKVSSSEKKLNADIAISINGMWTAGGSFKKDIPLTMGGGFVIQNYSLEDTPTITSNQSMGFVYIPKGSGIQNLVLKFAIAVTERDSSKATKVFTGAADLLKENREKIITVVEDAGG